MLKEIHSKDHLVIINGQLLVNGKRFELVESKDKIYEDLQYVKYNNVLYVEE